MFLETTKGYKMERKALKWETPKILYLSSDKSHGASSCANGTGVDSPSCTNGDGAQSECDFGYIVGPSGSFCTGGVGPNNMSVF